MPNNPTLIANPILYDNFVLENVIKSALDTKLDINRFMTADYSLAENPGMVKKVHKYSITADSDVDDLERGQTNSHLIEAEFAESEYRVARTQGQILYADDDALTDPTYIDAKVRYLSESMVNNWTKKAIAEFGKSENIYECTGYNLENFANALSKYTGVYESTEGLFFLANQKLDATLRKMLGEYLIYTEDYIRTGAIGAVLGIPVYLSKAVPEGIIYLATKQGVTAFIKRNVSIEQDRDIDAKINKVVASRYSVIALTDETRVIPFGPAQTTLSITTKTGTTVAGACDNVTGVAVKVITGGKEYNATVSAGAYTVTVDAMTAGDAIKVIASEPGKVNKIAVDEAV